MTGLDLRKDARKQAGAALHRGIPPKGLNLERRGPPPEPDPATHDVQRKHRPGAEERLAQKQRRMHSEEHHKIVHSRFIGPGYVNLNDGADDLL